MATIISKDQSVERESNNLIPQYSCPYHFHHNAEEMFYIISGNGELRTPNGIDRVEAGDIILLEKGSTGAHQLFNPLETPLLYLDLRTVKDLDICEYPDLGKVNILPERDIFTRGKSRDYYHKEANIDKVWKKIKSSIF